MKKIKLTKGQYALVDDADFEELNQYKWFAHWEPNAQSFYAGRTEYLGGGRANQQNRTIKMHSQILDLEPGDALTGDHKNPKRTLDNRRKNLRRASKGQQATNKQRRKDNTSGFKGVHQVGSNFIARIQVDGKRLALGVRKTAKAAHRLYVAAAKQLHGEFARAA